MISPINYRTGIPKPEGLLSEPIFWPLTDLKARKTWIWHIDLKYGFLNPLFTTLCVPLTWMTDKYNSLWKGFMRAIDIQEYFKNHDYSICDFVNSTTSQDIRLFVEDRYDKITTHSWRQFSLEINVFSNFYALWVNPSNIIIDKIPVIPAYYRPFEIKEDWRTLNSYINVHYKEILLKKYFFIKKEDECRYFRFWSNPNRDELRSSIHDLFYWKYITDWINKPVRCLWLSELFWFEKFIKPKFKQAVSLPSSWEIQKSNSLELFEIWLPRKLIHEILDWKDEKVINEKLLIFNSDTEIFTELQAFKIKIIDWMKIQIHPFFYDEFNLNTKNKINIKLPFRDVEPRQAILYNLICTLFVSQQYNRFFNNASNYKWRWE